MTYFEAEGETILNTGCSLSLIFWVLECQAFNTINNKNKRISEYIFKISDFILFSLEWINIHWLTQSKIWDSHVTSVFFIDSDFFFIFIFSCLHMI